MFKFGKTNKILNLCVQNPSEPRMLNYVRETLDIIIQRYHCGPKMLNLCQRDLGGLKL